MFRIIDRRLRSASSKLEKLENSAEIALAKAQSQAAVTVRSLSLRARSRPRTTTTGSEGGDGQHEGQKQDTGIASVGGSLLSLLSPQNWTTNGSKPNKDNDGNGKSKETEITDRPLMDMSDKQKSEEGSEDTDGILLEMVGLKYVTNYRILVTSFHFQKGV